MRTLPPLETSTSLSERRPRASPQPLNDTLRFARGGRSHSAASCIAEFQNCVTHGPGDTACRSELITGNGPLMASQYGCVRGCSPDGASPPPPGHCSHTCQTEFTFCVEQGPGAVQCANELNVHTGPLASVCDQGCSLSPAMLALVANVVWPPAAPPGTVLCTQDCANEFDSCVE